MTTFFIDLWHDLREKRLWPVAVGLLAAIVAVPVVLFKPAGENPPPIASAANAGAPEALPVVDVEDGPNSGSKLEQFDAKNPFKPLKDVENDGADLGSGGGSGGGSSSSGAPGSASALGSGSDSGSSVGGGGSSSLGGGSGSGGGGSTGSPGGSSRGGGINYYRYTVDVKFGLRGKKLETIKGIKQTQLLPDGKDPVLAYMGMADDARSAVFFIVDPAFQAQGEGRCAPRGRGCRFVYLGLSEDSNEESIYTADGDVEYTLELRRINREAITADQAKGDSTDRPASKRAAKAEKSSDLPTLVDLPTLLAERR